MSRIGTRRGWNSRAEYREVSQQYFKILENQICYSGTFMQSLITKLFLQTVRSTLAGRGTKLAVVLVQEDAALPLLSDDAGGSTSISTERASALCSACELSAREARLSVRCCCFI